MINTAAATLVTLAEQVLSFAAGAVWTKSIYFSIYLDGFGVDSDELTPTQMAALDQIIDGSAVHLFPFRPDSGSQKLIKFVGLASQTGPEANNLNLGKRRAENVYDYLASRLAALQVADKESSVVSVGSSKPRPGFNSPGSEFPENRAVNIILEDRVPISAPITLQPPVDDSPNLSDRWESSASGAVSVGDPIPILNLVGAQYITGALRNVQTGETRGYRAILGGIDLSIGGSLGDFVGANIAVNLQGDQFQAFSTPQAVDFDEFDFIWIVLSSLGVTDVASLAPVIIKFSKFDEYVELPGITLSAGIEIGTQFQRGVFILDDND